MKTIFLIGGFGFIGSNLLDFIDNNLSNIYDVIVFDKFQKHRSGHKFKCVKKVYSGDFSDETNLSNVFEENNIDYVLHFLSSTTPITSNNALYDIESNLIPTIKLLNIMQKYNVKDIVYLSSGGAIYGNFQKKKHSEGDAVYPKSSYGIVKLATEKYLLSYSELYGFNSLILRLSNPYGKYHYNDRQGIINIAIRKAINEQTFNIWGDGKGLKDYIYINDVCDIIFRLIKEGVKTNVLNIASGSLHSVNEIANSIKKIVPSFKVEYTSSSFVDIPSFELDITLLKCTIGEYNYTTFEEGMEETFEWEKQEKINN
ncbi:MAG: NAD-dependent epimerase/dehydratase family protein [Paraprevotella sp.]|nr:NAD-dependent epimerase/dehydratase family protein [Paraprevotella sp.]